LGVPSEAIERTIGTNENLFSFPNESFLECNYSWSDFEKETGCKKTIAYAYLAE